jgi:hypothetical protein
VPPKRRFFLVEPDGFISQKTISSIVTAVKNISEDSRLRSYMFNGLIAVSTVSRKFYMHYFCLEFGNLSLILGHVNSVGDFRFPRRPMPGFRIPYMERGIFIYKHQSFFRISRLSL